MSTKITELLPYLSVGGVLIGLVLYITDIKAEAERANKEVKELVAWKNRVEYDVAHIPDLQKSLDKLKDWKGVIDPNLTRASVDAIYIRKAVDKTIIVLDGMDGRVSSLERHH
jgi:hypothetical protein